MNRKQELHVHTLRGAWTVTTYGTAPERQRRLECLIEKFPGQKHKSKGTGKPAVQVCPCPEAKRIETVVRTFA